MYFLSVVVALSSCICLLVATSYVLSCHSALLKIKNKIYFFKNEKSHLNRKNEKKWTPRSLVHGSAIFSSFDIGEAKTKICQEMRSLKILCRLREICQGFDTSYKEQIFCLKKQQNMSVPHTSSPAFVGPVNISMPFFCLLH